MSSENLLSVTHFFAGLQYNDPRLFKRLGGTMAMLKSGSPLIQGIIDDAIARGPASDSLITVLAARFGREARLRGRT